MSYRRPSVVAGSKRCQPDAHFGEPFEVRRSDLRIIERAQVAVHVVSHDEKHIELFSAATVPAVSAKNARTPTIKRAYF